MREWLIALLALVVFGGAVALALRGYRAPPPHVASPHASGESSVVTQGPVGGNDAEAETAPVPEAATTARMNACVAGGVTTYTDQPCPAGSVARVVSGATPNTYTAVPAREVDMNRYASPAVSSAPAVNGGPADGTFSPSQSGALCLSIEAQIQSIDERTRHPYSAEEGDLLRDQRRRLREQYHALNCCTGC